MYDPVGGILRLLFELVLGKEKVETNVERSLDDKKSIQAALSTNVVKKIGSTLNDVDASANPDGSDGLMRLQTDERL